MAFGFSYSHSMMSTGDFDDDGDYYPQGQTFTNGQSFVGTTAPLPSKKRIFVDGRGILLALDKSLEEHLQERSDGSFGTAPKAPTFRLGDRDLQVRDVEIRFERQAIDVTSHGDANQVSVPGLAHAVFLIKGFGILSAQDMDETLQIDEVFGAKRIRASLAVRDVRVFAEAGNVTRFELEAVSQGEVLVTNVSDDTPVLRMSLVPGRRGIRLE